MKRQNIYLSMSLDTVQRLYPKYDWIRKEKKKKKKMSYLKIHIYKIQWVHITFFT